MQKPNRIPAIFYRTQIGSVPVREWLKALNDAERHRIGEDIAYVQYKWPIGKPRVDHISGPIWEVRSNLGNRIARTLFVIDGGVMIFLHGFIKKTQQTPIADIALALKRFKEWHHGKD